jgi:Transposase
MARTIGIDTGKNTLHLVGLDDKGAVVLREKLARGRIAARLANVPPCLIGIEAGMATHYVARELLLLGHDVRQVPPAYAKPFRQGHKNDFRDAHAIAEAVQRPSTRCVPVKTDAQLELQALHRVRRLLAGQEHRRAIPLADLGSAGGPLKTVFAPCRQHQDHMRAPRGDDRRRANGANADFEGSSSGGVEGNPPPISSRIRGKLRMTRRSGRSGAIDATRPSFFAVEITIDKSRNPARSCSGA